MNNLETIVRNVLKKTDELVSIEFIKVDDFSYFIILHEHTALR